jgi:hypothetical protein
MRIAACLDRTVEIGRDLYRRKLVGTVVQGDLDIRIFETVQPLNGVGNAQLGKTFRTGGD